MIELGKMQAKLERFKRKEAVLIAKHSGIETSIYNYWGGWDMGYLKGTIAVLENVIDDMGHLTDGVADTCSNSESFGSDSSKD